MGMQTKWQKFGKFDPAKQIDNEIKREILRDYTFDEAQIDEFVDDPRLLALAQIKFMNQEDKEYATAEKEEEISEMVAYLLNQNVDTDQVQLVTGRLLDRVYSAEFNQFVQDRNKLACDYALEVREKKLFIDICKNSERPKLVENSKMNYLLKYH